MATMANLEVKTVVTEAAITGTGGMVQGPGKRGYPGQCGADAILEFENSTVITWRV